MLSGHAGVAHGVQAPACTSGSARGAGRAVLPDPQVVHHVTHARHVVGDVLGPTAVGAAPDIARERHLAVRHLDLALRRVQVRIVGQAGVHVLLDAWVRPLVAPRATPAMVGLLRSAALDASSVASIVPLGPGRRRATPVATIVVVPATRASGRIDAPHPARTLIAVAGAPERVAHAAVAVLLYLVHHAEPLPRVLVTAVVALCHRPSSPCWLVLAPARTTTDPRRGSWRTRADLTSGLRVPPCPVRWRRRRCGSASSGSGGWARAWCGTFSAPGTR